MIIKKFEEQVKQFPHNTAVKAGNKSLTYSRLDRYAGLVAGEIIAGDKNDAGKAGQAAALLFEHGIHMIAGLIGALKANKIYVPMEITYPVKRLTYMLEDSGSSTILTNNEYFPLAQQLAGQLQRPIDILNIENIDIKNENMNDNGSGNPAYILYTSGSTGWPKGVAQTQRNVLYYIRHWVRRFAITEADRITLVSAFSHDGAVPDIFSSLLTGACLYPYSVRTGSSPDGLYNMLKKEKITIWHSVPSLFRHTAETLAAQDRFPHIRWVVLGGEPLRPHDLELVKTYFPNATLANIYGQTESTVNSICLISRHDTFDNVSIGEPLDETGIFLVNEDGDVIEDMGVGEIIVASDYLAPGYWRSEEKSAEVFLEDQELGKLYRTGDTGRLTGSGAIKIMGRQDQQVKIRGFRIELGEIESRLLTLENIKEAVVISRQGDTNNGNNNDRYLCAYITTKTKETNNIDRSRLRGNLADRLPDYMIPAHFVQLDRIPLLPNGKINRKALPAPVIETGDDYKAPGSDIEKKLAAIWSQLLGIEKSKISIDANFFLLGGHSLKATVLLSRVHKELKVEVPLSVLFNKPQIRDLAAYIVNKRTTVYDTITSMEKKDYYPQSAAQKRLFFLDRFDHISTSYNMPTTLITDGKIQREKSQHALQELFRRHQTLRTSFEFVDAQPVQRVHREIKFQIKEIQLDKKKDIPGKIKEFMQPFPLNRPPLLRMELLALPDAGYLILIDMHHIISDGTSQGILISEFCRLYAGEKLPPLKIQYKDFSTWQLRLFEGGKISAARQHWLDLYPDAQQIPRLSLPTDFPRPPVFIFKGDIHIFHLSPAQTLRFKEIGTRQETTLFMSLLTVFNILLFKYTAQEDIVVGCNVAGRTNAGLQGIIGMFVNELPIRNYPNGAKDCLSLLQEVKESSIAAFENQDYQFEQLVDKLNVKKDPSRNPLFDVEFAFQNFEMSTPPVADLSIRYYPYVNKTSQFDLALYAYEKEEQIYFHFRYCTELFKKRTIKTMAHHFLTILRQVSREPGIPLSHIEMISPEEKNRILYEFNSKQEYPPDDNTYPRLFERQVEKNPDRIAVRYKNHGLSYKQLENKANRLANYLYHRQKIKTDDRVAIWLDRSLNFPVAILGIMKAGAAYIPIDSSHPPERSLRIIDDAGVNVVISQKKYLKDLTRLQWESRVFNTFIIIDSDMTSHPGKQDKPAEDDLFELNATRKLWNYVVENAADEITEGGWLSGYTGKPFTPAEMNEYGDNTYKKLLPLIQRHNRPDMRVLEIGCASGITMHRLAPHAGAYYGIDISSVIIERNKQRAKENNRRNILLRCLPAHEIDKLAGTGFRLIIMNSVIQSFPGHHYFIDVMRKTVALSEDKADIFIGDVLDLDLKQNLIQDMIDFQQANRSKDYKTKTDWSKELFYSREFFEHLVLEIPGIKNVKFSKKIYTIENELTKYRYDALFTIDKTAGISSQKKHEHKQQHHLGQLRQYDSRQPPPVSTAPGDFAYIIFTSGTTGRPKGVVIHQAGMINHIRAKINDLSISPSDIIAQTASPCFDISVWQFLAGLIVGAATLIIDKETILEAGKFLKILQKKNVTILESVPSLMTVFLDNTEKEKSNRLNQLRWMIPTGEALPVPLVKKWFKKYPQIKLLNAYGPTEAADDVTHYILHKDLENETGNEASTAVQTTIPIGKPLRNFRIYILDKDLSLCPIGIRGEICVTGTGVGLGYLNNPQLTAESFINYTPPGESSSGKRLSRGPILYKTGDVGYFREDGNIECLGRIDTQVKIRGNRIELGEIENRLLKHNDIKEAVVTIYKGDEKSAHICAYYVPKKEVAEKEIKDAELRDYLSNKLPDYMIPGYFFALEKLPLTANGKVDRKALPAPGTREVGDEYIAPADEIEKKLARIMSRMPGVQKEKISTTDNFFEIGGHSLSSITLISEIYNEFGVELPVASVFKNPTLSEISKQIKSSACIIDPVLLLNPSDSLTQKIIFCFPPGIGFGLSYKNLAQIIKGYSLYSFNFIEAEDRFELYSKIIMEIKKAGPYTFFGYSAAGALMLELTKKLENKGLEVKDIIFLDCILTGKDRQKDAQEVNQRFAGKLEETLNKMGVGFLKDKILKKCSKYMAYEEGKTGLEIVNANIHLILSEETGKNHLSGNWDKFTTKKFSEYRGFGRHSEMLAPGFLEKNAHVIQEILKKIESE